MAKEFDIPSPSDSNPYYEISGNFSELLKDNLTLSFSFDNLRQIDFFGYREQNTNWFVSVLDKLTELSKLKRKNFDTDIVFRNANHIHKVNWDSKNVPMKRGDFNWLNKYVLENEEEFPFFQIAISTGKGRIIGYWETDLPIFNIILFDPEHNLQPSKKFKYSVDQTRVLHNEYDSLLIKIEQVKGNGCVEDCQIREALIDVTKQHYSNEKLLYFKLDPDYIEILNEELSKYNSLSQWVENVIIKTL